MASKQEIETLINKAFVKFEEKISVLMEEKLKNLLKEETDKIKDHCKHEINNLATVIKQQDETISNLMCKVNDQRSCLLDLEVHTRKYNILISGIEESSGESEAELEDKVRKIISKDLKVAPIICKELDIKAIHRLGKMAEGRVRTTIIVIHKLSHVSAIFDCAKAARNVKYGIKTHLPPVLAKWRDTLLIDRRDLIKSGEKARVIEKRGYSELQVLSEGKWNTTRKFAFTV